MRSRECGEICVPAARSLWWSCLVLEALSKTLAVISLSYIYQKVHALQLFFFATDFAVLFLFLMINVSRLDAFKS